MTQTRLTGFEAAAIRFADTLTDEQLAGLLAELIDRFATDVNGEPRASELRELAVAALVTARRMPATGHGWPDA